MILILVSDQGVFLFCRCVVLLTRMRSSFIPVFGWLSVQMVILIHCVIHSGWFGFSYWPSASFFKLCFLFASFPLLQSVWLRTWPHSPDIWHSCLILAHWPLTLETLLSYSLSNSFNLPHLMLKWQHLVEKR